MVAFADWLPQLLFGIYVDVPFMGDPCGVEKHVLWAPYLDIYFQYYIHS